ncbi:hypothetical protein AA957_19720 [Pseudomonas trivialis]|uniref:Uncharacterized protein n=1 Tax=Pseudomonas trivialis TaxID=200450 RepID=A0A0H5AIX5_9PSED|nr:hypothetical protein AA957_19720 [Pseudomonas trivialis]
MRPRCHVVHQSPVGAGLPAMASVQALAGNLAFDVDGPQRDAVLGIHRMVEGIHLMVDRVLDLQEVPISN